MKGLRRQTKTLNETILRDRGLLLTQVYDETDYIYSAIRLVNQNIVVGGLLTILVLLVFLRSGRVGFYLRVLQEGEVGAGDGLRLVEHGPERMTVSDISHLYYFDRKNLADCERALRIEALSPGWREGFQERLAKAGRG